jgi:cytoskeletal protein RodZ
MRSRYLEALEHDRWDDLPGRTYARAFLRTYASALDLDADAFVAEFDRQNPEPEELDDPAPPPPRRRNRLLPYALAPVAGLIAVVVVLVWSAWGQGNHAPLPTPPAPSSASAAPPPVSHHISHVRAAEKTIHTDAALIVHAVGGRCWIQARRGGPAGSVIAEQTLAQGQSLRLTGQHIWLRLGAPWNVQVERGTQPVKIAQTTLPLNLTA